MEDNLLWHYSLAAYRLPAVRERSLELQDRYGADINMLLCACWLASRGYEWPDAELARTAEISQSLQSDYLLTMRDLRRRLKSRAPDGVYQAAKRFELVLERWEQDRLWAYWESRGPPAGEAAFADAAFGNCRRYFENRGQSLAGEPEQILRALIAAVDAAQGSRER